MRMGVREKSSNGKRLIDANALISYIDECSQESRFRVYYGYAKSFIDDAPTIDAVPIVRCEKCVLHGNCITISIHALLAESDSKSAQNSGALLRI